MSILTLGTRVEYAKRVGRWRWFMSGFGVAVFSAIIVVACTGDDDAFRASPAQLYDASTSDHYLPPATVTDASTAQLFCGDAAGALPRMLVVSADAPGELAAVNLDTGAIDGRYTLDGGSGVTSSAANVDPWLLDEQQDLVTRLDPREPWKPVATWNVRSTDALSSTPTPARPVAVAEVSCTKAYIARFGRNRLAIIDPSASMGEPSGFIDLSPLLAPGDTGTLDVTSAVWVPTKKRAYVLAGNVDRTQTFPDGTLRCSSLLPSILVIDPATDTVVPGAIQLHGFDPPVGSQMLYDPAFDRFLVVTGGCGVPSADGGAPIIQQRLVEQIDLATGAVTTLLDLSARPRPTGIAFVDTNHAFVAFGASAFAWDPADAGRIAAITPGLDLVSDDGRGGFVGVRRGPALDGGTTTSLFTIPAVDGGPKLLRSGVFTLPGANAASLEPWPHR